MKRLISIILTLCLAAGLLAGCSSDEPSGKNVPMGRYVEQSISDFTGAQNMTSLVRRDSGEIVFYGGYPSGSVIRYTRYTLDKDGNLSQEDATELSDFLSKNGRWMRDLSESASGETYLLYSEGDSSHVAHLVNGAFEPIEVAELESGGDGQSFVYSGDGGYSFGYDAFDPDIDLDSLLDSLGDNVDVDGDFETDDEGNKTGSFTFSGSLDPDVDVDPGLAGSFDFNSDGLPSSLRCVGILASDNGFFLLFGNEGVYHYDTGGKKLAEFPGYAFVSGGCAVRGDTLLLPNENSSGLVSYDLSSMRSTGSYSFESTSLFIANAGIDENGIYIADSTGIYRQAIGGSVLELLVDGSLTSLVMPNFALSSVVSGANDDFYAIVLTGDVEFKLVRYYLDKDIPTLPDTELTMFALNDNATVRQTIGEFQRANPSVRVNLRVGLDGSSSATVEDVIRTLNTEILAGKGPDLLLLDGLPVADYVDKGVLRDLTGLADKIKSESNLLENLLGAYSYDGKIYGLASKFTLPVMIGESDALEGLDSLDTLVEHTKASGDKPFLLAPSNLYLKSGGMLGDLFAPLGQNMIADGKLDTDALERYLSSALELDRAVKEYTPERDVSYSTVLTMTMVGSTVTGSEELDDSSRSLRKGEARMYYSVLSGAGALGLISSNLSIMKNMELESLFHMNLYTPVGAVGILSNSKQTELAESFVKLLMSRTVQDIYLYDGFAVNADSLDAIINQYLSGYVTFSGGDDLGFGELARRLDTPIRSDAVLADAVDEIAPSVISGEVSPSDAAVSIADSLKLYLAE